MGFRRPYEARRGRSGDPAHASSSRILDSIQGRRTIGAKVMKKNFPPWAKKLIKEMNLDPEKTSINIYTPMVLRPDNEYINNYSYTGEVYITIRGIKK
jgi:hypothetical protein